MYFHVVDILSTIAGRMILSDFWILVLRKTCQRVFSQKQDIHLLRRILIFYFVYKQLFDMNADKLGHFQFYVFLEKYVWQLFTIILIFLEHLYCYLQDYLVLTLWSCLRIFFNFKNICIYLYLFAKYQLFLGYWCLNNYILYYSIFPSIFRRPRVYGLLCWRLFWE